MNKHSLIVTRLATMTLVALLLAGCPQQADTTPAPSGPPLTQLTAFPQEHLTCCWAELAKTDANYARMALNALNGDLAALEDLLKHSQQLELTPSYAHGAVLAEILNRVGDARFAWTVQKLAKQGVLEKKHPLFEESMLDTLRNLLEGGFALNTDPAIRRQSLDAYPETAKVLIYVIEAKKG